MKFYTLSTQLLEISANDRLQTKLQSKCFTSTTAALVIVFLFVQTMRILSSTLKTIFAQNRSYLTTVFYSLMGYSIMTNNTDQFNHLLRIRYWNFHKFQSIRKFSLTSLLSWYGKSNL